MPTIHTQISEHSALKEAANSRYVFIGPPFNIGRQIALGTEVPITLHDHPAGAVRKRYFFSLSAVGLGWMQKVKQFFT